ncbi:Glutathione peroxidase [Cupriavidus necator]|uniref:Glutathione peroxidase n=1 Tax=Cupriavidus necator (strain ATCC 17699 / DSM 428 / KCTC 22496 / NCIMB 10442 / H16 / Stanier 337) TaxID=381666 RepID=Q0KFK4_CUPNH|nr:glutathione peroxidase [Cupriavidus necator]KUE88266.1 glutathione peroxidase [Cupriavidus necator]QCB99182.1 glutathione peroxidase [Cupriavidus necator H16]QQB78001.1 glutathione peroxidase [Cupriavidus necator]WKA41007.1 glutathione peroxidase [Cupriavidus necator]CAJ91217.1 glutathione peroxidase [Cupriavidus necator H16]
MIRRPLLSSLAAALTLAAASTALLPAPVRAADKPAAAPAAGACPASLNFTFPRLQDDVPQNLCQYAGKVVLVVNTASYCGFTPQYEGLEALYAKYGARGLVVLGFPSNDFSQEPGSQKEIADFCYNTYGVKFPMLGKSHVRGSDANPMYALLAKQTGTTPKWNFYKYLIGRDGQVVASYGSRTRPDDKELVAKIESLLGAQR